MGGIEMNLLPPLSTNTVTMKTLLSAFHFFGIAAAILFSLTALVQAEEKASIGIVILDDQIDPGLVREGIKSLQAPDLDPLVNAAINSNRRILLRHLPVIWNAKDAPVAALEFTPFTGGSKPTPRSGILAYREKLKAAEQYRKDLLVWERKFKTFADTTRAEGRAFGESVIANQVSVTETHDRLLIENNGREKQGLDLIGAITHANLLLSECKDRILVINSPCADRSVMEGKRDEILKPTELDLSVQIYFVNTSRRPQEGMLFKGLPNTVVPHGSLARALAAVSEKIGEQK